MGPAGDGVGGGSPPAEPAPAVVVAGAVRRRALRRLRLRLGAGAASGGTARRPGTRRRRAGPGRTSRRPARGRRSRSWPPRTWTAAPRRRRRAPARRRERAPPCPSRPGEHGERRRADDRRARRPASQQAEPSRSLPVAGGGQLRVDRGGVRLLDRRRAAGRSCGSGARPPASTRARPGSARTPRVGERRSSFGAAELAVEMLREERQEARHSSGRRSGSTCARRSSVRRLSRAREMSCATAFSFSPTTYADLRVALSSSSRSASTSRWRGASRAFATRTSSCWRRSSVLRSGSSSIGGACRARARPRPARRAAALDALEERVAGVVKRYARARPCRGRAGRAAAARGRRSPARGRPRRAVARQPEGEARSRGVRGVESSHAVRSRSWSRRTRTASVWSGRSPSIESRRPRAARKAENAACLARYRSSAVRPSAAQSCSQASSTGSAVTGVV